MNKKTIVGLAAVSTIILGTLGGTRYSVVSANESTTKEVQTLYNKAQTHSTSLLEKYNLDNNNKVILTLDEKGYASFKKDLELELSNLKSLKEKVEALSYNTFLTTSAEVAAQRSKLNSLTDKIIELETKLTEYSKQAALREQLNPYVVYNAKNKKFDLTKGKTYKEVQKVLDTLTETPYLKELKDEVKTGVVKEEKAQQEAVKAAKTLIDKKQAPIKDVEDTIKTITQHVDPEVAKPIIEELEGKRIQEEQRLAQEAEAARVRAEQEAVRIKAEQEAEQEAAQEAAQEAERIRAEQEKQPKVSFAGVTIPLVHSQGSAEAPQGWLAGVWTSDASTNDNAPTHIIGHNPGAFSHLFNVGIGSQITVTDFNGTTRTYTVDNVIKVDDEATDLTTGVNQWETIFNTPGERITLQACIDDYTNIIVFAS